ncbi:pseudaminic acid cytidylyltransferase [Aliivibrio fischeri]|uniref:pseudaminic acid cytidylyltransferase n=1 Tax=Aliivibrio fischeri TaxID=668 RepID=UPI0012DAF1B7|nr:pseudaminic acid cytidylyltransferase [Aliivibrio fischeri]MUL09196.1 pseudaminic acid cytidylyltransferase [Aliivibrio fischeri]MUL13976.1 pseudaminic acid cytidylyltransferase [Aliivibrio fischeri]
MKIAIIPARGGSKRIPRKNIKLFYGKPMIAYSIEAAIESNCFDKVIVSTDDHEIAEVAKQYGAEVPFMRPENISDDYATTMDVIQHAVQWCEQQGLPLTHVCCLYATAPFVQSKDLQKGWEIVQQPDVKYAFSATPFPFPIQRAIKLSNCGSVSMFSPEHELTRSQDLEESYHDAGQFYWGEVSAFKQGIGFFNKQSRIVELPRKRVQDIDTPEDWEFAEVLFFMLDREKS